MGPAHDALKRKWERLADPDGTLEPDVRARRAAMLMRANMIALSLSAAEARAARTRKPAPVSGTTGRGLGADPLGIDRTGA